MQAAISGKGGKNLADIDHMSGGRDVQKMEGNQFPAYKHTGELENVNSMGTLKYMPKAVKFRYKNGLLPYITQNPQFQGHVDQKPPDSHGPQPEPGARARRHLGRKAPLQN